MGEITLSTGKVVTVDTKSIQWNEWRGFFSGRANSKQDDAFIEKCTGITPDEQGVMLRDDMRRIITAILKVGNEPLSDPNSPGAST